MRTQLGETNHTARSQQSTLSSQSAREKSQKSQNRIKIQVRSCYNGEGEPTISLHHTRRHEGGERTSSCVRRHVSPLPQPPVYHLAHFSPFHFSPILDENLLLRVALLLVACSLVQRIKLWLLLLLLRPCPWARDSRLWRRPCSMSNHFQGIHVSVLTVE